VQESQGTETTSTPGISVVETNKQSSSSSAGFESASPITTSVDLTKSSGSTVEESAFEAASRIYSKYVPPREAERKELKIGITEVYFPKRPLPSTCIPYKNLSIWQICDPPVCVPDKTNTTLPFPPKTNMNVATTSFIDKLLRLAWGKDPPVIDLYLRAGCGAAHDLRVLFQSINLFFPRFLGEILLVLDYGNSIALDDIIPLDCRTHAIRVIYEHAPCMSGRFFNQYSYLKLHDHSKADYVVTIDSDCVLFAPVTPDLLFNARAQLIIPTSLHFQKQYPWNSLQKFMTGASFEPYGHPMITQPVSFRVSSFPQFFEWIQETRKLCYELLLEGIPAAGGIYFFCWMCQMTVLISEKKVPGYELRLVDDGRNTPYIRFAVHVKYDRIGSLKQLERSRLIIIEGLCKLFGSRIFRECDSVKAFPYLESVVFGYANEPLFINSTKAQLNSTYSAYQSRFRSLIGIGLKNSLITTT